MARPPHVPRRDEVPADEREHYDAISQAGSNLPVVTRNGEPALPVDTSGRDYYSRMLVSPEAARAIRMLGGALRKSEFTPGSGSFSPADHELIDLVLSFDAGYWGLLRIHLPAAVAAGVRIDTIEALRTKRDSGLDDDTAFAVQFIREVCSGTLTDDSWDRMEHRLGSERGVLDYAMLVCLLQLHLRLHQVLKVDPLSEEEYSSVLDTLRSGRIERSADELHRLISNR